MARRREDDVRERYLARLREGKGGRYPVPRQGRQIFYGGHERPFNTGRTLAASSDVLVIFPAWAEVEEPDYTKPQTWRRDGE